MPRTNLKWNPDQSLIGLPITVTLIDRLTGKPERTRLQGVIGALPDPFQVVVHVPHSNPHRLKPAQVVTVDRGDVGDFHVLGVRKRRVEIHYGARNEPRGLEIARRLAALTGLPVSGADYYSWLGENGITSAASYRRADRAVRACLGAALYEAADAAASLEAVVEHHFKFEQPKALLKRVEAVIRSTQKAPARRRAA